MLAVLPGPGPCPARCRAPLAVVQFAGPVTSATRAALERTGADILDYEPDHAYLVWADASEARP